uniref:Uncharacterized protein n=1 Tax=Lygus hesperus TaxID=30085 RepID=A0A146MCU1_LYGHE
MPLEWTGWRKKLIAVDYPDAASLNDAQTVFNLLFRPTPQRKKLIAWVSRKVVEFIEGIRFPENSNEELNQLSQSFTGGSARVVVGSTTIGGEKTSSLDSDVLSIFLNFVYGSKGTLEAFIKATLSRNNTENIWISILDDLKPRSALCGNREARNEILLYGTTTLSAELLELLGITGPPSEDSSHSPDIFDEVDDVVKRAEALLTKPLPVVPSTSPCSPEKIIRPLAKLKEDARKLSTQIRSECSVEEVIKRNEQALTHIRTAAADFEEFVDELRNLKVAVKKLDDIKKKCDGELT